MTGQISVPDDFDRMGQGVLMESDASLAPTGFFTRADNQRMKTLTITAARRCFGALLDSALRQPILITRRNKTGAVIMSAEAYEHMIGASHTRKSGGSSSTTDPSKSH